MNSTILKQAAAHLELHSAINPPLATAVSSWLREAAHAYDAADIAARKIWPDDPAQQTEWIKDRISPGALATARAILSTQNLAATTGEKDAAAQPTASSPPGHCDRCAGTWLTKSTG